MAINYSSCDRLYVTLRVNNLIGRYTNVMVQCHGGHIIPFTRLLQKAIFVSIQLMQKQVPIFLQDLNIIYYYLIIN